LYYHFEKGILRGWQVGSSLVYIGERMAGRSTRVTVENDPYQLITLPAYTTLDLNAGYQGKSYTIRFKVSNLTNALSYNVHDDNSVNPIAPRQFATTISYRF
jgi:iron complex outermembrane receptor protein